MKNNDLLSVALQNIRRQKGRSALVILAAALSMGCLLIMMALGEGGAVQFQQSISANDATEIRITQSGAAGTALDDRAVGSFKGIEGVAGATGVITLPMQIKIGRYAAQNVDVAAVDPTALQGRLAFGLGGLFTVGGSIPQIVLGYGAQMGFTNSNAGQDADSSAGRDGAAEPTPPPVDWLGQRAELSIGQTGQEGGENGADFSSSGRIYSGSITGVLKENKSDWNGRALMNLAAARKILREDYALASSLGLKPDQYASALVYARDVGSVKAVVEKITAMGYSAESAVAGLEGLQQELGLRQTLLAVIEIFAIITAVLLMAFILLCGQAGQGMDGTGAAPVSSFGSAVLEAAALGLAGGAAGVLLGFFFALITNTSSIETVVFYMHFGQNNNLLIPLWMCLVTLGVSVLAGLVAGGLSLVNADRQK